MLLLRTSLSSSKSFHFVSPNPGVEFVIAYSAVITSYNVLILYLGRTEIKRNNLALPTYCSSNSTLNVFNIYSFILTFDLLNYHSVFKIYPQEVCIRESLSLSTPSVGDP